MPTCTRFFHQHATSHRRRNFIQQLEHNGQVATSPDEKAVLVHNYFLHLLDSSPSRSFALILDFLVERGKPLPQLEAPFSDEEVWVAVKDTSRDKAPGPDGFTGQFYQTC